MPPCVWSKPLSAPALLPGSAAAPSQDAALTGLADGSIRFGEIASVLRGLQARATGFRSTDKVIDDRIEQDRKAFLSEATCRF